MVVLKELANYWNRPHCSVAEATCQCKQTELIPRKGENRLQYFFSHYYIYFLRVGFRGSASHRGDFTNHVVIQWEENNASVKAFVFSQWKTSDTQRKFGTLGKNVPSFFSHYMKSLISHEFRAGFIFPSVSCVILPPCPIEFARHNGFKRRFFIG